MLNVLVVGGAGYIGSHMVKYLGQLNCKVTTLDNLSTGYRDAVLYGDFILGDLADEELLNGVFDRNNFDAVMHFASFSQVAESVSEPSKYYQNNVVNTLNLLNAMRMHSVKYLIFSSTAAVYGEPYQFPINETHSTIPLNTYGRSKLIVEHFLKDFDVAYDLKYVSLRYFNAAGADPDGELGERHNPETHLIPLVLQVASGKRPFVSIFGNQYGTHDGTCVRDYVHVLDICSAHWLALKSLLSGDESQVYNLGNGCGFSVKDVISAASEITGGLINFSYQEPRSGDPAKLVANSDLIARNLGWQPIYPELNTIIQHAWMWEKLYKHN